jgi:hypothetical protein
MPDDMSFSFVMLILLKGIARSSAFDSILLLSFLCHDRFNQAFIQLPTQDYLHLRSGNSQTRTCNGHAPNHDLTHQANAHRFNTCISLALAPSLR